MGQKSHYLDLAILAGAGEVGSGAGVFFVSGDRAAYEAHRGWFERIGTATYVDDVPAAAYVSGSAVIIGYLPMEVCLLQGLRICKQHEFSSEWFKGAVLEFYPRQIRVLLDLLAETPDPSAAEAEGSVDVMRDWADELAVLLRGMGLDSGMYDALHRLFAAASTAGHGDAAWTRIAEHTTTGSGGPSPNNQRA